MGLTFFQKVDHGQCKIFRSERIRCLGFYGDYFHFTEKYFVNENYYSLREGSESMCVGMYRRELLEPFIKDKFLLIEC